MPEPGPGCTALPLCSYQLPQQRLQSCVARCSLSPTNCCAKAASQLPRSMHLEEGCELCLPWGWVITNNSRTHA